MTPRLQEIIQQAENETWSKMNSFGTVLEAVSFSKVSFLKERIAVLAIQECIKVCESLGNTASKAELMKIIQADEDSSCD